MISTATDTAIATSTNISTATVSQEEEEKAELVPVKKTATVEVSVLCDPDDGADHFVYSDPAEDKLIGDQYAKGESVAVAETSTTSSM